MNEIIVKENEKVVLPILWTGDETQLSYTINLAGRGAEILLYILLLGRESNRLELQTNVFHNEQETKSKIIVKGALSGNAMVNYDGLVKISPGAKGTNAWLAAHLLLLSNKSKGRAVPSLEILENDIKAGHATTVGRVNDEELFYLMSRGIPEKEAKMLIVEGFFGDILPNFPTEIANNVNTELRRYLN
jgi:Fe-S cluster assembly protein SufD